MASKNPCLPRRSGGETRGHAARRARTGAPKPGIRGSIRTKCRWTRRRGLLARHARHLAAGRRHSARRRDVQPAQPARGASTRPRRRPDDRQALFRPPTGARPAAARPALRRAILSPGSCRGRRAARAHRRPLRGRPGGPVERRRHGSARAGCPRGARRFLKPGRSCCATTARRAPQEGLAPETRVAPGTLDDAAAGA